MAINPLSQAGRRLFVAAFKDAVDPARRRAEEAFNDAQAAALMQAYQQNQAEVQYAIHNYVNAEINKAAADMEIERTNHVLRNLGVDVSITHYQSCARPGGIMLEILGRRTHIDLSDSCRYSLDPVTPVAKFVARITAPFKTRVERVREIERTYRQVVAGAADVKEVNDLLTELHAE